MSTRPFTLFNLFTLFLLLSLLNTHQVNAFSTPSIDPSPSSTPSSSPSPVGPTSSPPVHNGGATNSPNPTTKSNSPPPSHSLPPTPSNSPDNAKASPSSESSSPVPSSSSSDPVPSSSSASTSSSLSPSSSIPHNTAVVDQSRTGLVVAPTNPGPTVVNAPSQDDPSSTDGSNPTDAAAGNPVSFLQNKGAVAGTFTVVGLVVLVLIFFLGSYFLRKRRERNAFDGDYDEFDTSTQKWSGAKFMGNRRDTYARSSFGMAAMAEKSHDQSHDYPPNETLPEDLGTEMGHQEMRTNPFDPYQNNYALPSHNLGPAFDNTPYQQGYDNSHLAPPFQHQQQPYTIPHHIPPISTFGHGNGPLIATATAGDYQTGTHNQQDISPDSMYTPTPIAAHYAQNPYHLDSYYGGSTSLNPAPPEQPQQHQQSHQQEYHTSARDPSTRSGPTEWGVAC